MTFFLLSCSGRKGRKERVRAKQSSLTSDVANFGHYQRSIVSVFFPIDLYVVAGVRVGVGRGTKILQDQLIPLCVVYHLFLDMLLWLSLSPSPLLALWSRRQLPLRAHPLLLPVYPTCLSLASLLLLLLLSGSPVLREVVPKQVDILGTVSLVFAATLACIYPFIR